MKIHIFALLIMSAGLNEAAAAVFGVEMGTPIKNLKVLRVVEASGPMKSYSISVPLPHSEFENYIAVATDQIGVCKISGIGRTHEDDKSGLAIQRVFRELTGSLKIKYGNPTNEYDFLHAGSIWRNSDEFAAALTRKERSLATFWFTKDGWSGPSDIASISLIARGLYLSDTYVVINYEFNNFSECIIQKDRDDSRGL